MKNMKTKKGDETDKESSKVMSAEEFDACYSNNNFLKAAYADSKAEEIDSQEIIYFTVGKIENQERYICLNKTSLYTFSEQHENAYDQKGIEVEFQLEYASIRDIIVVKNVNNNVIIRFKGKDQRFGWKPIDFQGTDIYDLVIETQDQPTLIMYLISYWKTAYMFNYKSVKKLNKTEITKYKNSEVKIMAPKIDEEAAKKVIKPKTDSKNIFIWDKPSIDIFHRDETEKVIAYSLVENGSYKMFIQTSNPESSVAKLKHFNMNRDELEDYTMNFTLKMLSFEPSLGRVWIISSKPHLKRKNLTRDKAEWSGWEIQAKFTKIIRNEGQRAETRINTNIVVITIERRKYIPPSMDKFWDFILISMFSESLVNNDDDDDDSKAGELEDDEPNIIVDFKTTLENHRKLIDSLRPTHQIHLVYDTIIREKMNSLILSSDALNFYRYQLNIDFKDSQIYIYAFEYIKCLINMIESTNKFKKEFKKLSKFISNRSDYKTSSSRGVSSRTVSAEDIRKNFEKQYWGDEESKETENEESKKSEVDDTIYNWKIKVAAFFTYWVNGGLWQSKFTLTKLIEGGLAALTENNKYSDSLAQEICYLLQIRSPGEVSDIGSRPITNAFKRIIESKTNLIFDEQVMITMLELGYVEKDLEKGGEVSYYSAIKSLLETTNSEDIRMSVCRVIIRLFNDNDDKAGGVSSSEDKLISAQQVVNPVLYCYKIGRGPLKELSIDGLYNMCITSPMEYIGVMEKGDINNIILDNICEREVLEDIDQEGMQSKGRLV